MDTKLVISCLAVSALLIGGCTHQQANKPQAGDGQTGPVSDGKGGGSAGSGYITNPNGGGSGGNGRNGSGAGGNGTGSGGGSANGNGSGGGGGLAQNNGSGNGRGGSSGNGSGGGFGSGNAGNGSRQAGNYNSGQNQGGFGSGSAYGGNTKGSYTPADLRDPNSILAQRIIYFDYNQSGIRPEYRKVLDAHGSLLADFPKLSVRLEGHADERGSRAYNVALSERRAYSVRDYLSIKGVGATQTDVVGYGEEVPATFGHGEGSWSKNRRVEIIYAGE